MVGQFALGLAVTAPVIQSLNLQLRNVQVTDTKEEYAFGDYLGLRLVTTGVALLVIATIVAAGGFSADTARIVFVMGLAKLVDAVADTYFGLLQQDERMDSVAMSQVLRGLTGTLALGLAISTGGNLLIGVLAMALISLLLLFLFDIPSAQLVLTPQSRLQPWWSLGGGFPFALRPRWQLPKLTELARIGLPLGVVVLLISLNANVPSYVVGRLLGESQLGLFAALAFVTLVVPTVVNALGQSASPRLARAYHTGQHDAFRSLTWHLLLVTLGLSLGSILAAVMIGRPMLEVLYTSEDASQSSVLLILMAAAGVVSVASVLGVALTATRCFAPQLPLGALVTVVTTAACFWFVSWWGLAGAGWALLLSCAVQVSGLALLLARRLSRRAHLGGPLSDMPGEAIAPSNGRP